MTNKNPKEEINFCKNNYKRGFQDGKEQTEKNFYLGIKSTTKRWDDTDLIVVFENGKQETKKEFMEMIDEVFLKHKKNSRGVMKKQLIRNIEEELLSKLGDFK